MPKLTKEQKQDNKLFEEFKKKFGLRLKQVSSKRVSHQDIRQEFRRLDSMARLLEGNSTCVAVYFHLPTETIWIFNNNIHDNSRESNVYIREMQHIFNLITNEQLTLQTIKSNLLDIIVSNIAQEERWAMATLKTQKKILHEEIGSYLDNLLKSGVSTKAWQNNFQPDLDYIANVGFLEKIKNKTAKIVRDFLKIRDFLLYNHKKKSFSAIFIARY